jgi:hypothetical protein
MDVPWDIWDKIHGMCKPWEAFCLSLVSKAFMDRYEPAFMRRTREETDKLSKGECMCLFKKASPCDQCKEYGKELKTTMNGEGRVWGRGIKFQRIKGYTCEFICENDDGPDEDLMGRLLLIDDYWKKKKPSNLRYKSFVRATSPQLVISGEMEKERYTPCTEGGVLSVPESSAGILNTKYGWEVDIETDIPKGYESVGLLLEPHATKSTFRLRIKFDQCAIYIN